MANPVPASQITPMLGAADLGLTKRRTDLIAIIIVAIITAVVYTGIFILFLILSLAVLTPFYGYPTPELKPGPLVSQRYSFEWWLILFMAAHVIAFVALAWSLQRITGSLRRTIHLYVSGFFLLFDFLLAFLLWFVACFLCNSSFYPNALCNDDRYCLVYAAQQPTYCPPLPPNTTALDPNILVVNPAFSLLGIWTIIFLFMGIINVILNSVIATSVRNFVYRTRGQGTAII